jgi:sulfur carrier protein
VSDLWLLEARELDVESTNGFAIARNGIVVRKDRWDDTKLADGDRVEIVRVMQGG